MSLWVFETYWPNFWTHWDSFFGVQKDSFLSLLTGFKESNHWKTCKLKFLCYFRCKHRPFSGQRNNHVIFVNEKRLTWVKFWLIPWLADWSSHSAQHTNINGSHRRERHLTSCVNVTSFSFRDWDDSCQWLWSEDAEICLENINIPGIASHTHIIS